MRVKIPDVNKLRPGTGVLVGGCYVVFIDWANSNHHLGRVLRVRGEFAEGFTGWVDSISVWVSRLGCFVPVALPELVSVVAVDSPKCGKLDVGGLQ